MGTALIRIKSFFIDENGQGMVEYGLILALVVIVVIAAVIFLGDNAISIFTKAANEVSAANGG